MRHPIQNADAVVAGGGLAGLAAAALLARSGQRVALFERSESTGGRAITNVKDGYYFNLGPHAWYPGGPGTGVLTQLGIRIPGRTPKPAGAFAIRHGRRHTLPIGFVSLLTTDLLSAHGKLETGRILARLMRMDASAYDDQTFADWANTAIGDPVARDVIAMFARVAMYTDAPGLMSAGASLAALQLVLRDNVQYVDRGWQSIVDALESAAVAAGVEIIRSMPVDEVIYDRGVEGVRLADGHIVSTRSVVLAVPPDVARRLVARLPEPVTSAWTGIPAKAACLDVGLARLPKPAHTVAFGVDRPLYYSVHSATADLAPAGGATIHVAKYLDPSASDEARSDRQELEELLDLLQPGWRAEVVVDRFLPRMTVVNAIPLAARGGLRGRTPVEVGEVPGLFLAGDWVGAEGTLASAAIASAARAADRALQRRRSAPAPAVLRPGAVA